MRPEIIYELTKEVHPKKRFSVITYLPDKEKVAKEMKEMNKTVKVAVAATLWAGIFIFIHTGLRMIPPPKNL